MTNEQKTVLRKIIYAVETGGQVYGQQDYSDFTEAYTNSSDEHAITIGAGAWYGIEAKTLLERIYDASPEQWEKIDKVRLLEQVQTASWECFNISRVSQLADTIVALISSDFGVKCQDNLMDEQLATYAEEALEQGVTDARAQAMCVNFRHQGGQGAVTRILAKTKKPYTIDNLYAACQTDTGNQVGAYKDRQRFVYNALKTYFPESEVQQMVTVKISNCGHDENGRYAGGKAGDQTGTEYQIIDWYNRPWLCILRFEDPKVASLIAEQATQAAKNNMIGYDQGTAGNSNDRYTFWEQLVANGYDPSKIKKPCETDCSQSTASIVKSVGYRMNLPKLKAVSIYLTTYDMRQALKNAGAKVLTDSKYLTSGDYVKAGDILLNDNHHVAIAVTSGAKASTSSTSGTAASDVEKKQNTVAYVARFTKDCKCYSVAGKTQAKMFPVIKKNAVVDVMKYTETVKGKKWYFIRIPHPTEGFVFEFVPSGYFTRITEISK